MKNEPAEVVVKCPHCSGLIAAVLEARAFSDPESSDKSAGSSLDDDSTLVAFAEAKRRWPEGGAFAEHRSDRDRGPFRVGFRRRDGFLRQIETCWMGDSFAEAFAKVDAGHQPTFIYK